GVRRDQDDVHGVQHELDRHQDQHGVAPDQYSVHAKPEQERRDDVWQDRVDHGRRPMSGRDTTMAPTSAASSHTESASNGSTQAGKIAEPTASAPLCSVSSTVAHP